MEKYIFRIIVNGKEWELEGHSRSTAEIMVRGIMCWYPGGTIFTVIDPEYKVSVFRITTGKNRNLADYVEELKSK